MKFTQISNVLQIMMWKSCSCKTSEIDLGKHWRGLAWERPVILLQNVSPPLSLAFSISLHFTLMFSCFLSLTLSDHPKLSMDSQLTQQEATRFRLLWEEFLPVSSWWWALICSFQPSRLHKFSNLKRNWKGGGFSVRPCSSAKLNYKILFQHLNLLNIQFTSGSRLIFCGSTPPGQQYGGQLTKATREIFKRQIFSENKIYLPSFCTQ